MYIIYTTTTHTTVITTTTLTYPRYGIDYMA